MQIRVSDVLKKDFRIVCFLVGSWAMGLALFWITTGSLPERLGVLGLIPVINYIAYRIKEELNEDGYIEAIRGEK